MFACAKCGAPMNVIYGHHTKDGDKRYYYLCKMQLKSKSSRCTNANARAADVDAQVRDELKKKSLDRELFLDALREQLKQGKQELKYDSVEAIRSDIKQKEKEIERLRIRVRKTDDEATAEEYENDIKELRKEMGSLNAKLTAIGDKKTTVFHLETTLAFIERLLDKCGQIDELDIDEQRALVKALYERITWNSDTNTLKFYHIFGKDDNDDNFGDNGGNDGGDDGGDDSNGSCGSYTSLEAVVMGDSNISQNHITSIRVNPKTLSEKSKLIFPLSPLRGLLRLCLLGALSINKVLNALVISFQQVGDICWVNFHLTKIINWRPMKFYLKISPFDVLIAYENTIKGYLCFIFQGDSII